jgi:hypothetical protein
MSAETVGSVVVEELKKQARQEGYYVVALSAADLWLIATCAVYFCLGALWAAR